MHVQRRYFAYKTYCFFDVLVAVRVVGPQRPYFRTTPRITGNDNDQSSHLLYWDDSSRLHISHL